MGDLLKKPTERQSRQIAELEPAVIDLQLSPGNVFEHLVERACARHDHNPACLRLQTQRHLESLRQIESVQNANHVVRQTLRRQFVR